MKKKKVWKEKHEIVKSDAKKLPAPFLKTFVSTERAWRSAVGKFGEGSPASATAQADP